MQIFICRVVISHKYSTHAVALFYPYFHWVLSLSFDQKTLIETAVYKQVKVWANHTDMLGNTEGLHRIFTSGQGGREDYNKVKR